MIELDHVTMTYESRDVVKDITLQVKKGEIFGIIGPSGSGKTTLLKIINLIEKPSSGRYRFDGSVVFRTGKGADPIGRRMAMLFQKPVMFNASVDDNIGMGLRFRGVREAGRHPLVEQALQEVGLAGYGQRKARTLSGGEAQRVALARAIVISPDLLLLDEPTANLDPKTAVVIEEIIRRLNREKGMTIVLSTHDLVQGQRLCDRIGVVIDGQLCQVGTPVEIFHMPGSTPVAHYVGVENIFNGRIIDASAGCTRFETQGVVLMSGSERPASQEVAASFRAEDVTLIIGDTGKTSARNLLPGKIVEMSPYGPFTAVKVDCGITITAFLTRTTVEDLAISRGSSVTAAIKATAVHLFGT
jgi:tungstate transport system ATP-binding protein